MKRKIYSTWDRSNEKTDIIEDIRDNIDVLLGADYIVLQTPVLFDIDLIDVLLLGKKNNIVIVKVLEKEPSLDVLGKIAIDYVAVQKHIADFRKMYPSESINIEDKIELKVFVPNAPDSLRTVISCMSLPCELFAYEFVLSGGETGLVINRVCSSETVKPLQDYSSILKIMGENVRSESSSLQDRTFDLAEKNDAKTDVNIKKDSSAKKELSVSEKVEAVKNITQKKPDYLDVRKLSEEELVAFFDFEKKIEEYHNTQQ